MIGNKNVLSVSIGLKCISWSHSQCCVEGIRERESSRCGLDYLRTEKSGNTLFNFCSYKFLTSTFNLLMVCLAFYGQAPTLSLRSI